MKTELKYVFANSVMAFVAAFLLTTLVHESGHFISYLVFNAQPVLHHNYVLADGSDLSVMAKSISAMAGPVISLLQGILFLLIVRNRQSHSAKDFFYLWLGFLGLINFFGYLMLTPLSGVGDTGKVAQLLHIPFAIQVIISVAGLTTLIIIIFKNGKLFGDFIPRTSDLKERGKFVNAVLLFPVMIGSLINALLAFPVQVILSVIYPATSSYVVLWAYGKVLKPETQATTQSEMAGRYSLFLLGTLVVMVLINRLLIFGFHF